MTNKKFQTHRLVFAGVMAAVVFVVTIFKIPFLSSNLHFANAACLLSGMLFGSFAGGCAAGIGSALYDLLVGGYDPINCLITLVSKFAMAYICGLIAYNKNGFFRTIVGSAAGALTYVALYILKTFIFKKLVDGLSFDAVNIVMIEKLIPSLMNAAFAVIIAPIFYAAIAPVLKRTGLKKYFSMNEE